MCIVDSIKKHKYIIIIILIIIIIYLLSNKNEYLDISGTDINDINTDTEMDSTPSTEMASTPITEMASTPSIEMASTPSTNTTNVFTPTETNIKGGYVKDRGELYVCKIKKMDTSNNEIEYPGQIAEGEQKCTSTNDGLEIKDDPIMFQASDYEWVNEKDIATPTGFSYNNKGGKRTLFTCRGIINDNNSIQIGKAFRNYNFCNIPFNGEERLVKPYDFLKINKSV
jgi:hypothetical protein